MKKKERDFIYHLKDGRYIDLHAEVQLERIADAKIAFMAIVMAATIIIGYFYCNLPR